MMHSASPHLKLSLGPPPKRFYGSVKPDPTRLVRDVSDIAKEVVQHLNGLVDAEVSITLEIQVKTAGGVPEHVVRTVTENCRTLKFTNAGFEEV